MASLKSDLPQDFGLVLAEPRGSALERERALAHDDRAAQARRPLRLDAHAARDELRIGEKVGDGVDRTGRDDRLFQRGEQPVPPPQARSGGEFARQLGAVCDAGGIGGKARVARQPVEAEDG